MAALLLHSVFFASVVQAYSCLDFVVPITINATSYKPTFPAFNTHYETVQFLTDITTRLTTNPNTLFSGSENVTATFDIDASLCSESDSFDESQDLQVLSHGVAFDRNYWEWGGANSSYNYVYAATQAGYATLSWSRPGNGESSSGDPYSILQVPIEAAVLIELTKRLHSGDLHAEIPKPAGKVLHVGHSFGSVITNVLISTHPELSDGVALTGLSHDGTWAQAFPIATNFHLARENDPERFGNLSAGILTWADEQAFQYAFFKYPNFDPDVLKEAEAHKFPFAVSEFLTLLLPSLVAPSFTGPVLLTTGDSDFAFCGGNCHGILEPANVDFPASRRFATYLQPDTGHGLNLHYNASGFYEVVLDFFEDEA